MADINEQIEELEARLQTATGVKRVMVGDQMTEFDADDIRKQIALLKQQQAATTGVTRTRLASTSKGV